MKRAKILSASAGSGKTFQLALKYMCDIIERPDSYRNILAVTFTNKATEEMKSRILREIHVLASGRDSAYLRQIQEAMDLDEQKIRERALVARNKILHDFSRFNVLTIDKFFQRILRAFIKELGLDLDYAIELDTDMLLERSAENLVYSISTDEEVRSWLLDFAEEVLSEGEKWDIRGKLRSLGKQLFSESGAKDMKLNIDKNKLQEIVECIKRDADACCDDLKALGEKALAIMKEYGVNSSMFKNKSTGPAGYFEQYAKGVLKDPTSTMLKGLEGPSAWYAKGAPGTVICAAEKLYPIFVDIVKCVGLCIEKSTNAKLIHKQYRTFALLVDLQRCINDICNQENLMVLSKTKDILEKFVVDNNAPFIYEKIGNRYDRYMMDEFQDTSLKEWRNMLPLLKEALASNSNASVFIVGDVKQSIYRWRGGHWQLLSKLAIKDLGEDETQVDHLKKNYRSLENVVNFNNAVIGYIVDNDNAFINNTLNEARAKGRISESGYVDHYDILRRAYSDHVQIPAIKSDEKGYVEVCAFDNSVESPFIAAIESAIARGYRYRDILILVRYTEDAKRISKMLLDYKERNFVSQGLPGFNILMPEALTLDGCDVVEFVLAVMRLSININNDIDRGLFNRFLGRSLDQQFSDEDIAHFDTIAHLSPMEAFEDIILSYGVSEHKESIAYLQAMHEQVVAFNTSRAADIHQFLKWWEEYGKKVTVTVEMADDTMEIMTIHKAKGLERDVVIIPDGSWNIHPSASKMPVVWAQADAKCGPVSEIGAFPVLFSSDMAKSSFSEKYYSESVMNHVDALNLIYVAITRASKELYIYVPYGLNAKSRSETNHNISTTGRLVLDAVARVCPDPEIIMEEGRKIMEFYRYGAPISSVAHEDFHDKREALLESYISTKPSVQVRFPAQRHIDEGTSYNESMSMGILLHSIFEKARNVEDLRSAIEGLLLGCRIDESEAQSLELKVEEMLANPAVQEWFGDNWDDVKCEASILSHAKSRRPDRVMIRGDKVVVVDYKFGDNRMKSHQLQVAEYVELLESMNRYSNIEGYVWYVALGEVVRVR